jgi:SAM-dependent methyltransferase
MIIDSDPIGKALRDYLNTGKEQEIEVLSDVAEPDILPVSYFFRRPTEMPELEQIALSACIGKVLDVGAGAGAHSIVLKEKGLDVTAIDSSPMAVEVLKERGINAVNADYFLFQGSKFDTLLLLMNGIGIVGSIERLDVFFQHARSLLNENGQIICDSTDIRYIYEEEDGSMWVDLNGSYYGELQFKMNYKDLSSEWFNWLYIDETLLTEAAERNGFSCEICYREDDQYLAILKRNK